MGRSSDDFDWNDKAIARLRQLWDEGVPTAEIGRRMGVSKCAVVGKAHRLDLPARPSPINRGPARPRVQTPHRKKGPTLPPLATIAPYIPSSVPPAPVVSTKRAPAPPPPAPASYGRTSCCWPEGEPGTKSFRFCGAAAEPGKPYCTDHCGRAYVRVRDRREAAARASA